MVSSVYALLHGVGNQQFMRGFMSTSLSRKHLVITCRCGGIDRTRAP
jgi:hypothetical protein